MLWKKVKVAWDLDTVSLEEARVHEVVDVPLAGYRPGRSVSDYLFDEYGWLVMDWWDYAPEIEEEHHDEYQETVLQEGRKS